jgi:hypothetical protein
MKPGEIVVSLLPRDPPAVVQRADLMLPSSVLGEWKLGSGDFDLDANAPSGAGVYAFVVDDVMVYVGLSQRGLRGRLTATGEVIRDKGTPGLTELPRQRGFHEDEMVAQFRRCFVVGRDLVESERAVEA